MASTVPYAAPYARSAAPAKPVLQLKPPQSRYLTIIAAMVLTYLVVQVCLASMCSSLLLSTQDLNATQKVLLLQRDALRAQVETYKSPAWIETQAAAKGFVPLTKIEFGR